MNLSELSEPQRYRWLGNTLCFDYLTHSELTQLQILLKKALAAVQADRLELLKALNQLEDYAHPRSALLELAEQILQLKEREANLDCILETINKRRKGTLDCSAG